MAIGSYAGVNTQGQSAVAIGYQAGYQFQQGYAVAIGAYTGNNSQQKYAVAIGYQAGHDTQGEFAVAIGYQAGRNSQKDSAIAIGNQAGNDRQGTNAIAIGNNAQTSVNITQCVAIGYNALATIGNSVVFGSNPLYDIYAKTFNSTSDVRSKENIISLKDTHYTVDRLHPITYIQKSDKKQNIGFLAHELQQEIPFLVNGEKDDLALQSINYTGLIGLLVREIQECKERLTKLEQQK